MGGHEYETIRSYQNSVKKKHGQFIKSEFGVRQRLENKG
jgi:hypothetical protein